MKTPSVRLRHRAPAMRERDARPGGLTSRHGAPLPAARVAGVRAPEGRALYVRALPGAAIPPHTRGEDLAEAIMASAPPPVHQLPISLALAIAVGRPPLLRVRAQAAAAGGHIVRVA